MWNSVSETITKLYNALLGWKQKISWDRVTGIIGNEGMTRLHNANVAIVGLGSLGSEVAVLLAKSGVGSFTLIDPDTLSSSNIPRHAADARYIGQYKVDAVADLLRYRNNRIKIRKVAGDVLQQSSALEKTDLVIVAGLGSELVEGQLGVILRNLAKPALFGGVYAKAVAGEIYFVHEHEGPCYSCFATAIRKNYVEPKGNTPLVYGMAPDQIEAEPGLGIHINRVATTMAHWALTYLCGNAIVAPMPSNLVILSNETYSPGNKNGVPYMMKPATSLWQSINLNPNCGICQLADNQTNLSLEDLLEE